MGQVKLNLLVIEFVVQWIQTTKLVKSFVIFMLDTARSSDNIVIFVIFMLDTDQYQLKHFNIYAFLFFL